MRTIITLFARSAEGRVYDVNDGGPDVSDDGFTGTTAAQRFGNYIYSTWTLPRAAPLAAAQDNGTLELLGRSNFHREIPGGGDGADRG
jgi:hypothetical protein